MFDNIMKITGMTQEAIELQVREQHDRGDNAMKSIKSQITSDFALYRSSKKHSKKEAIGDWSVFSTHSALMALSYTNRPESEFMSTDIGLEDGIKNLNNAYKTDFNTDDMEVLSYWEDFYKFLTGVSITARNGWNGDKKKSTFEVVDTRNWIPDPDGDYVLGNYAHNGFYRYMYKHNLIEEGLWNSELVASDQGSIIMDPKKSDQIQSGVHAQQTTDTDANPLYKIYYHFAHFTTEVGSTVGMVITGNSNNLTLGTATMGTMPFAFKYWNPDGTLTGTRVPQITGDIQRIKAEIANLRLDKSKAELYPMYLRNSRMIPNKGDLDFGLNKVIDANPMEGENLANALTPLQKDFRVDQSFVIDSNLDRQIHSTTNINKVTQGSSPERREAVGVVDEMMNGTDNMMMFRSKIEAWGEKQKLRLYLEGLREDMKSGDKKEIDITTSYGVVSRRVSRKELVIDKSINIKIVTAIEKQQKEDKLKIAYGQAIGMIQTLPLSESAKKFMYRDYFEVLGLDKAKAERIINYEPDEITAIANTALLNEGVTLEVKMDYDPMTHLTAIKSARPGLNVDLYRRGLMGLYKIKGKPEQPQDPAAEGVKNNIAAQAGASIANQASAINS